MARAPRRSGGTGPMGSDDDRLPVFVYGTLRPGAENWFVVDGACVHHEPAVLRGHRLYLLDYPAVVGASADGADGAEVSGVWGDVLSLAPERYDESIEELDRFEGFDPTEPNWSYYVRERLEVVMADGSSTPVWVYLAGPASRSQCIPERLVASGDWLQR